MAVKAEEKNHDLEEKNLMGFLADVSAGKFAAGEGTMIKYVRISEQRQPVYESAIYYFGIR
ncbi:MAG: hypothetical protein HY770_06275 [Chitinivibrionia bacterium]|nr:hypothetical protein [Chitinivibrionia bacterium]